MTTHISVSLKTLRGLQIYHTEADERDLEYSLVVPSILLSNLLVTFPNLHNAVSRISVVLEHLSSNLYLSGSRSANSPTLANIVRHRIPTSDIQFYD